jgi:hypothetical protein
MQQPTTAKAKAEGEREERAQIQLARILIEE